MRDTRKNIKAAPAVKADIESIRLELGLKTESQALAYLAAMYRDQKSKRILLADHQRYLAEAEEKNNQASI